MINSVEFLQAVNKCFEFSTQNSVEAVCYTQNLDKVQIVALGKSLGAPFDLMWPCYLGGRDSLWSV